LRQTVETNRSLLVDGPASVRLLSGKADSFGYQLKERKVVVKQGKRLPFFVMEKAEFEISLGPNANIQEVDGSTIPPSWNTPLELITSVQSRPMVILVVGQADSGKSSFCTYLVNKLLDGKSHVAVLDGDLGQSDIGPSATIGYGIATKPITKLYNIRLINAFFVGHTSPMKAISKILEGLTTMKTELLTLQPNYVIINTDGLVSGEFGAQYKTALVQQLKPDIIVGLQINDELSMLISNLEVPVVLIEPSSALSNRTPEKRKSLREMSYIRYLRRAKLHCYPISQLKVEPRSAVPKNQVPEKGILVGLYGYGNKFLGIGVLRFVNQVRKVLKVQASVTAKPTRLVFGKVILNKKFQELVD
jgi:polynucleotide 5'-hydroxyl-kinase GRC3/NOL9